MNQPQRPPSSPLHRLSALVGVTLLLAACGGGGGGGIGINAGLPPPAGDTGRGSVVTDPPEQTAKLTADQFRTNLQASDQGKALLQVAGTPRCGVEVRYLEYRTVGGTEHLQDQIEQDGRTFRVKVSYRF